MRIRTLASTLVAALAIASTSLALQATKMEMPKPPAELAQLKFFDGNWTCDGTALDSPMGPGGKMQSRVKSQTDLGGFWQTGNVTATMVGMPAMEGMFRMTYDPGLKQYVLLWMDSMGAYSHETSAGWQGDKLVFVGDMAMGGKKARVRDTFTKASDGSLKHAWEAEMDGKWTPLGQETCRKAAGN